MTVLYATDHSSYLKDGRVFLSSRIYPIIQRYANTFGDIILYSRFIETDNPPEDAVNASFISGYVPVRSLLKTMILPDGNLEKAIQKSALVIGRVPAIPAYKAIDCARKHNRPYMTEAMGCAWDAYWNHGFIGKLAAPYMYLKMRFLVKHADYASYVTSEFLQKRYPRKGNSLAASNVLIKNIDDNVLNKRLTKIETMKNDEIVLMTTAAVNVKYKGQQFVIEAIPEINRQGIRVKYYVVGDGDQSFLQQVVNKCRVQDQVVFTGRQTLEQVFQLLDNSDVYVQPSLQEGLPRSVIEAMSRGCIVIGAKTAGIPELLEKEYVVSQKSSKDIAELVVRICNSSKEDLKANAVRNFEESKNYYYKVLDSRKSEYYQSIKNEIMEVSNT